MQDSQWDVRRKELQIDDEDGLLQLQAQFLAGQSKLQPAAGVTRITRKPPPQQQYERQQQHARNENLRPPQLQPASQLLVSSAKSPRQQHSSGNRDAAHVDQAVKQTEQLCPGIPGILTDIKENMHEAAEPMDPQAVAPCHPFPIAQHRKHSKFALARQARQTADGSHASMLAAGDLARPAAPSTTYTAATALRPIPKERNYAASTASNASLAGQQEPADAAAHLQEANVQRIAEMTLEEIQVAQQEITQRFKPSVLEHLRRRHVARQHQAQGSSSSRAGIQETPGSASALLQPASAASNPQGKHNASACAAAAAAIDALNLQHTGSSTHHPQADTAVVAQSTEKVTLAPNRPHARAEQPSCAAAAASTSDAAGTSARARPESKAQAPDRSTNAAQGSPGLAKGFLSRKAPPGGSQHKHTGIPGRETAGDTAVGPAGSAARHTASSNSSSTSRTRAQAGAAATAAAGPVTGTQKGLAIPAVARLRFSIHGQVLDLSAADVAAVHPEEVLMRDSISRAAGSVPDGYTLPEMAALVRSRHAPQRAMGFRMLAAVLRRARPSVYHVNSQGELQAPPVVLEGHLQQQQQQEQEEQVQCHEQQQEQQRQDLQQDGRALPQQRCERTERSSPPCRDTGVKWSDVWQYAVVALRAVILCRMALDEDNLAVLAAAADSLRVLLGRSSSELLLEEVAASSSSLSWPLSWQRDLKRLHASGVWSSVEDLVKAAHNDESPVPPGGYDESSLLTAPEDLAALDPMSGFLATDPLTRIRFLLQQHKSNAELVSGLLAVLEGVAALSRADAESVVRLQHMPDVLITLLDLGHLGSSGGSNGSSTLTSAGMSEIVEGTSLTCRVSVLRLLRLLCAASSLNSQLLRTAGLETAVQLLLCTNSGSRLQGGPLSSQADVAEEHCLLKLEALRVWRVAAAQGISWCHMDLMFSFMAEMLQPPTRTAGGRSSSMLWHLSCEAFQLLEVLVKHAQHVVAGNATLGREMITPGCAAAIAGSAATDWLQQQVMLDLAQAFTYLTDSQLPRALNPTALHNAPSRAASSTCRQVRDEGREAAEEVAADAAVSHRIIHGLHPALLMPPAAAPVYAVAAVLQYLATYWSTLQQVPKEMALELHQQLSQVGLCTACTQPSAVIAADPSQHVASGSTAATAVAGSLSSSQQQLALQLLAVVGDCRQLAEGDPQQQQQQPEAPGKDLGAALLHHCCALLHAAGQACSGAHDDGHVGSGYDILAVHTLSSAAAVTLLGVCDLQDYVQRHCRQLLSLPTAPLQQQQHGREPVALPLVTSVTNIVCGNVLLWLQSMGRCLSFEAWCWARHMLQQYQIRLLLRLAPSTLASGHYLAGVEQQLKPQPQQQQISSHQKQPCEDLLWPVVSALLGVLPLSSPGQEGQALGALRLLFDASLQQQQLQAKGVRQQQQEQAQQQPLDLPLPVAQVVLSSAAAALQKTASKPVTAAAAAGLRKDCLSSSSSTPLQEGPDIPYPLPHFEGLSEAWPLGSGATALSSPQHARPAGAATGAAASAHSDDDACAATGAAASAHSDAGAAAGVAGAASAGVVAAAGHSRRGRSNVVDTAQWCEVLLQGYCVTWLSVIHAMDQQHQQSVPAARQPSSSAVAPLPHMYVEECEGSRLPAPKEWLLSEIHAVPPKSCQGYNNSMSADGSSSSADFGVHPASAALLLGLGLEVAQHSGYMECMPPGRKLEAMMGLMYSFDAGELLPPPQPQQQHRQQLARAWQDAAGRWAAACLTECLCAELLTPMGGVTCLGRDSSAAPAPAGRDGDCGQQWPGSKQQACRYSFSRNLTAQLQDSPQRVSPQQQQQQQRLFPSWSVAPAAQQLVDRMVRDLAELSYGDPLFGAHVALLLLPAAGSRLQRCCWGALVHQSGLHVLPPPWRCFVAPAAYLGVAVQPHQGTAPPCTADQSSSSKSTGSSTLGSDSLLGFPGFDSQLVGDMAKALAQGELEKALQMQGLTAFMALHGIAALCLDQGSWRGTTTGPAAAAGGRATAGTEEIKAEDPLAAAGDKLHGREMLASDAALAVNVLRGVIRACAIPVMSQLLMAGRAQGLTQEQQARALVQAAHGDDELMEKVRRLLS